MMIYTVIPEEYLMVEPQEQKELAGIEGQTMQYQGMLMHILVDVNGKKKLLRLHTTNPNAYLKFQPGQLIM